MEILLITIAITTIGGIIFTSSSLYFFKKEILYLHDKILKYFSDTNNRTNRNFGRAARILPLANYPINNNIIKEIELVKIKKHIIIKNPDNNFTLGVQL